MEFSRKPTLKNSYDGFGESFGRVARSGKVESTTGQLPAHQTQPASAPPPSVQGVAGFTDPMMYGSGVNQTWNSSQNNWNDPYASNGINTAFYPPMYVTGPQFGQGFGNQFQFQRVPAFQTTNQMPGILGMPYGNPQMQPGPMAFNQFPHAENQTQIMDHAISAGEEESFLVPPGTESQNTHEQENTPYMGTHKSADRTDNVGSDQLPHTSAKGYTSEAKTDSQSVKIMEGLVTACCKEYGFMGPDVFFATSCVRGNIMPQEGDLVLVEAEMVEGLKFQYVAKRVQVLKLNAAPKSHNAHVDGVADRATVPGNVPPAPIIKPLRNPPPPPIISKPSKSSVKSSRSRSRSRDRRHRGGHRSPRLRSPLPQGRVRRDRSRSKTPDRRTRGSGSRDEQRRNRRRPRNSKSRSRSKSPKRSSHRKRSKDERSSPVGVKGLNIDINTLLEDKAPNIEIIDVSDLESPNRVKSDLDIQAQNNLFRPTFVEVPKVATDSRQKSKPSDTPGLNIDLNDLLDYNIWGIPELPDVKSSKNNTKERGEASNGKAEKNNMPIEDANFGRTTPHSLSKLKQISIKLGYMENKTKPETSSRASAATSSPAVRVQYVELPEESKRESKPTEHGLKLSSTSFSNRSRKSEKSDTKRKLDKDLKKENKHSEKGHEHRKHVESSSSSHRCDESRWRGKQKDDDAAKQEAFVKKFSNYTDKNIQRKSPGGSSSHHHSERSSSKSTKSSRHKHDKDTKLRLSSPVVSLVLPPVDGDRSPTPTEDEIIERERQIRLRELQLEEERILLERKMRRMGSRSRSPDVDIQILTSPSPRLRGRSSSRSRSRSPIIRRRRRRSYSRSSRSRSRSRGRPSRNEQLVRDLAIRHSRGNQIIDLDDFPSPERSSFGSTSYRGQPLEYEAPVARRVRESISPSPLPSRNATDDPSLVLRLGRILRNGASFVCYVCGKKGHHGTVCWFRQPGVSYPEDDEPI